MKILEYIIKAFDRSKQGTDSAAKNTESMKTKILGNLMNIKAGWDMVSGAFKAAGNLIAKGAKAIWTAVKESFRFETLTTQFNTLIGDMGRARQHMAMLKEMGDTPPFSLEEFAKTSRAMMVMSDGVLGYKKSLELVGDAAAATGIPIEQLGDIVGRAYALIRDGEPISRAAIQLRNMGVVTPAVVAAMQKLQSEGGKSSDVWDMLVKSLEKHKGAMDATLETGKGLTDALGSQWTNSVRIFGDAFADVTKGGLKDLLDRLKELNEDGTIEVWANKAVRALEMVKETAQWTAKAVSWIYRYSGASDAVGTVKGLARGVGALSAGGSLREINAQIASGRAEGFYSGKVQKFLGDPGGGIALNKQTQKDDLARDNAIREKKKQAVAEEATKAAAAKVDEAKEGDRIATELAAADAGRAAKRLAEEEAARIEAAKKEADERAVLMAKQLRDEHDARMKNVQAEAAESSKLGHAAQDRLGRARQAAQQAWGWYRDPAAFSAQLQEEKAEAGAQKQFDKDFSKLKDRRDWRTNERLSERDESVRRVALAREEEQAAAKALVQIEKNTAGLAEKLDALMMMKGGD